MSTLSVQLPDSLAERLHGEAERRCIAPEAVVRESLEKTLPAGDPDNASKSLAEAAGEFIGRFEGPSDLATNSRYPRRLRAMRNRATILVDAGPLVALLVRTEKHHPWAREQAHRLDAPLHTCEPVLAETAHLLRRSGVEADVLLEMIERGVLRLAFNLGDEASAVRELMRTYRNVPMSLADACLVRMSEGLADATIFTLDTDFRIYRRHRTQPIPLLMPPAE